MKRKILLVMALCLALLLSLSACISSSTTGGDGFEAETKCEHNNREGRELREHTCTQTGIYEEYCIDCGEVFGTYEEPEPLGHLFVNYNSYTEATCSTPDVYVYYCEREFNDGSMCGVTEERYGDEVGNHKYEYNEKYMYSFCTLCEEPMLYEGQQYKDGFIYSLEDDGSYYIDTCLLPEATSITIPEMFFSGPFCYVDYDAFAGCTAMEELIIPGYNWYSANMNILPEGGIIEYENGYYYAAGDNPYFYFLGVIDKEVAAPFTLHPDTCSIIGDAFYGSDITSVEIPASVRVIAYEAFAFTENLTSIVIPEGISSISSKTFWYSGITSITLPDTVTSVGQKAFEGSQIVSIDLSNVTSISEDAFYHCSQLETVVLNEEITYLTWNAFRDCSKLSLVVPETVESFLRYCLLGVKEITVTLDQFLNNTDELAGAKIINIVGNGTFPTGALNGAYTLIEEIHFGGGITRVMPYSIIGLPNLKTVGFGGDISHVEANCFYNCPSVDTIVFSECVSEIDFEIFSQNYENGFEFTNENGLSYIGNGDNPYFYLYSASGANGAVVIPEGVVAVSAGVFSSNSSISSITLPDTIRFINGDTIATAFATEIRGDLYIGSASNPTMILVQVGSGKSGLYTVDEGVKFVMENVFSKTGVNSVAFGDGILQIKPGAFTGITCASLPARLGTLGEPPMADIVGHDFGYTGPLPMGLYYIPQGALISLPADAPFINEGTYFIGKNAFAEGTVFNSYGGAYYIGTKNNPYYALIKVENNVSEVTIHEDTVLIAQYAFTWTESLSSIVIPDSVKYINAMAFYGIDSLESVVIGNGVLVIGYSAFESCAALESVEMGENIRVIESMAFAGCTALSVFYIPSTVMVCGSFVCSSRTICCQATRDYGIPYADTYWNYDSNDGREITVEYSKGLG